MALQFNQIPGNIRVPFVRFEVNAGQSPYQTIQKLVLMGQPTSAGTAVADTPILVTGGEDGLFGVGSMLAAMYKYARSAASLQEIWCVPLADAPGSAAATGTLELSGSFPISTSGTVILYIGGIRVSAPVNTTMSSQNAASAIINAINACEGMQVTPTLVPGAAATATINFTGGPLGAANTIDFSVNGVKYSTPVLAADTNAQIATKVADVVNASSGSTQLSASVAGATVTLIADSNGTAANSWSVSTSLSGYSVAIATAATISQFAALATGVNDKITLTANNKGTLGNTINVLTKYYADDGDLASQILTVTKLSGGAGDPTITNAIANMGDGAYDWVVMPYCNSAYLAEMDAWETTRWSPMSQVYGHTISAMSGTAGAVQAFTSVLNSWHLTIMPSYNAPHPTYLWAAVTGAVTADHMQSPPELSRPMQTLVLTGLLPPVDVADRWSTTQRQSFYYAGASGYRVGSGGEVEIDRLITTYQRNAWGQPDQSWLDINTIAQLMYGLPYLMQYITSSYPRPALVDSNPNNIQGFVTADDIRSAFIHAYKNLEALGVFENSSKFAELLIVERNASDPNRVDTYLPLDHVNGLRVLAVNATSYLQYTSA